jgi:hypothetical protein
VGALAVIGTSDDVIGSSAKNGVPS